MDTIERALEKQRINAEFAQVAIPNEELVPEITPEIASGDVVKKNKPEHVIQRDAVPDVMLDFKYLGAHGFLTPKSVEARSTLASEFRSIKRTLLKRAYDKELNAAEYGNLIMVTSALPSEGKSFVSINLALSIAMELDTTVLLVDCDVIKPSISATLAIPREPGLVDYLADDKLDLSELILKTNVPSLSIVPAGRPHTHSNELLHSENMRELAHEMATRYPDRIVIFDSPPLLATTEAAVLATMMGQVIVVVEAVQTGRDRVMDALDLLDSTENVSFVLNKSRNSQRSKYGYYGYGASTHDD